MSTGPSYRVSIALAVVSEVAATVSFFFWGVFSRDVPMGVGNLRGTALTILVIAVPALVVSMAMASRGSVRARFVWLGSVGYLTYNAVLLCFASHFNAFFLLYTTMLALAFWALVTLVPTFDLAQVSAATYRFPVRSIVAYLVVSLVAFGSLWLAAIVPPIVDNSVPSSLEEMGITQNPIWVLDFAFTFPLMVVATVWLLQRRAWGYVLAGMLVIMLTIETASIAIDQVFGNIHDSDAPLAAVPIMIGFTVVGLVASYALLRRIEEPAAAGSPATANPRVAARVG